MVAFVGSWTNLRQERGEPTCHGFALGLEASGYCDVWSGRRRQGTLDRVLLEYRHCDADDATFYNFYLYRLYLYVYQLLLKLNIIKRLTLDHKP